MSGFIMKRRSFLTASGALSLGAAAGLRPGSAFAAAKEVSWLTWENLAYDKYIGKFITDSGVNVRKGFIGSDDEQFAKIRAGGADSFDRSSRFVVSTKLADRPFMEKQ